MSHTVTRRWPRTAYLHLTKDGKGGWRVAVLHDGPPMIPSPEYQPLPAWAYPLTLDEISDAANARVPLGTDPA